MNLGNVKNSMNSGLKFVDSTIDSQIEFVKSEGGKCVDIATNVAVEGGKCIDGGIKEVGDGVRAVGDTALNCVNLVDGGVDNILKLKRVCQNSYEFASRFKGFLEDDSLVESTLALAVWLLICYFFQIWMIPVAILLIYVKNLISTHIFGIPSEEETSVDQSVKEQMKAIQEVIGLVRALLSNLESVLQKIFGFINLKSLSWIVILIQVVITFVLMYIPINYLLMLWGISIYSKKFLKKKSANGTTAKNDGETVVEATEELQDVAGDFLSFNIRKGFNQLTDSMGKLSSKHD